MVEANVAVEFDEPVWIESDGNFCDKKDSVGFMVTHSITHPGYFMVADELRGNISQKGDMHVRGTRLLCEKVSVPKQISSNEDKHFTLLGFTTFTSEPIMRAVILTGVNQNSCFESGINFTKEFIGDAEDPCFFENNFDEGKPYLEVLFASSKAK